MVKVVFVGTGVIWKIPNAGITRTVIGNIFDLLRWERIYFSLYGDEEFTYAKVYIDEVPRMIVGMSSTYKLISSYRNGHFYEYRRLCKNA